MTYSDLLHRVSFDEIAPYIRKYGSKGYSLVWYKIHYDMLRQLEPRLDEDDEKTATISNAELYYDWEEPHLDAYPMEGSLWEASLAKELVVNEDVNATWAEIAACRFGTPRSMVLHETRETRPMRDLIITGRICSIMI